MVDRVKLVMLGDQGSGKTSLVYRYAYDQFYNDYQGTIGIDFLSVNHTAGGRTHKVQIWDTAGQERFRSLVPSYVRDSRVALVVFDVCSEKSFGNVQWWLDMIMRERNRDNIVVGLVGNKIDKEDSRMISTSDARTLARDNNVFYVETSAKTGHKVKGIFTDAIQRYLREAAAPFKGAIDETTFTNVTLSVDTQDASGSHSRACCSIL